MPNPNHEPAGTSKGGEFAKSSGANQKMNEIIRKGAGVSSLTDVYHGASEQSIEYIKKNGLITKHRSLGMSSTANDTFTFVTTSKSGAKKYANENTRNKGGAVVKMILSGVLYNVNGVVPDYVAFGTVAKEFNIMHGDLYDYNEIASALEKNGYAGLKFRDRNANGRISMAVLPKYLEIK